ncbi:hypothetical protein BBJ28_00017753 [Nothophytophthora sp. Chile5]|nr:hypothetical protein BBJ28_00017753 [Nothophytophthora sp. Chile5]
MEELEAVGGEREFGMEDQQSLFDHYGALIGLPVRVQLSDQTVTAGLLHCIDPQSDSVALLCPQDAERGDYSVKILLAHRVRSMEKAEGDEIPTLAELQQSLRAASSEQSTGEQQQDAAALQRRRGALGRFLDQHFVQHEVAADGSLRVFGGAATLRAPFAAVQCGNEQLLRRLQELLLQFQQQQA